MCIRDRHCRDHGHEPLCILCSRCAFLFHHSLAVAITAQEMAAFVGISPDVAYTAGMLHDVGQLCFHIMDETLFEKVYTASIADGKLLEREAQAFGADHCQVGAQLALHWN